MTLPRSNQDITERFLKFLDKANIKFNNRFNYSKANYINAHSRIKIDCPDHGEFEQEPYVHTSSPTGCPKCSTLKNNYEKSLTTTQFIKKCEKVHGKKFDYSLVTYTNMHQPVNIICPDHGEFKQEPWVHLGTKYGCPQCSKIGIGKSNALTTEEFIKRSNEIHNNRYDYSNVVYSGSENKIDIICPKHGKFSQHAGSHMHGTGCPNCSASKGEAVIIKFLSENNIEFITQHKFPDCKNKRPLPFDFYLPGLNICIEYDGMGHYKVINRSKDSEYNLSRYIQIIKHDKIKNDYCIENNIKLIRISYIEYEYINEVLIKHVINKS